MEWMPLVLEIPDPREYLWFFLTSHLRPRSPVTSRGKRQGAFFVFFGAGAFAGTKDIDWNDIAIGTATRL